MMHGGPIICNYCHRENCTMAHTPYRDPDDTLSRHDRRKLGSNKYVNKRNRELFREFVVRINKEIRE